VRVLTPKIIRVELVVKFRALGVTFGTVSKSWIIALPRIDVVWDDAPEIHLNERGIRLDVWVE